VRLQHDLPDEEIAPKLVFLCVFPAFFLLNFDDQLQHYNCFTLMPHELILLCEQKKNTDFGRF
jgi:hypothetical protein